MSATTTLVKRTFVETNDLHQLVKEEFLWEAQGADTAVEFLSNADDQLIHYTVLDTLQEIAEELDDEDLMEVVKQERANGGDKPADYLISIDY